MSDQQVKAKQIHDHLLDAKNFVLDGLGCRTIPGFKISNQQAEFLELYTSMIRAKLKRHNKESLNEEETALANKIGISVMSGKGTGKDACCGAWAGLHFSFMFPFSKVTCTANNSPQLTDVLWSEFAKWKTNAIPKIKDRMEILTNKVYWKRKTDPPGEYKKRWWITGRSANLSANPDEQAEALGGRHEDYMLFIIDEGSKVPDAIYRQYITTCRDPMNMIIVIFNPTMSTGFAMDTQKKYRDRWACLQWDSEKSDIVPKEWIEMMKDQYGEDSMEYQVYVKGLPPTVSSDALIPFEWQEEATTREFPAVDINKTPAIFGLDVGFGGDDSVIVERYGPVVHKIHRFNMADTTEIVKWAANLINEKQPARVFVDNIAFGSGVKDILAQMFGGDIIRSADVRRKSYKEIYAAKRDEIYFTLREAFQNGEIKIPNDSELRKELSSLKYGPDKRGRTKIISKEELKRKGIKSPNRADALMLSYYWGDKIPLGQVVEDAMSDFYEDLYAEETTGSWMTN